MLSVVICYFKTNECGEGLECAAYPFSVVLLEIPNQLNGFYDAESGLQQTEHLVKKENAVEEMPFFWCFPLTLWISKHGSKRASVVLLQ